MWREGVKRLHVYRVEHEYSCDPDTEIEFNNSVGSGR